MNETQTLVRRGTTLLRRGKHKEAAVLLEQALQQEPHHFDAALNLSAAYILDKKFKKAVPVLEALTERHPENAMLWTNLGAAYLGNPVLATEEKQFQAVQAFVRALEIDPTAPSVAYNVGLIHKDRREYAVALEWFELALRTNPEDKDALHYIRVLRQREEEGTDES